MVASTTPLTRFNGHGRQRLLRLLLAIIAAGSLVTTKPISPPAWAVTPCLNGRIVGMASTPSGAGYWLVGSDGGVFTFGDAAFFGSAAGLPLNKPVTAIVATSDGRGYWLVAQDGGVFAYGNASPVANNPLPGMTLNQPVVGAARAGGSAGLWLTAADGGVFALNGAPFYGSAGNIRLNKPVTAIVSTAGGSGYWLVAQDGGVFAYGNATPVASNPLPSMTLNQPIVGAARAGTGTGLWLTAADGGVFALNGAPFYGSAANLRLNMPVTGVVSTPGGRGYWQVAQDGGVFAYSAGFFGSAASSSCPPPAPDGQTKIVKLATAVMNGQAQPGWGGGPIPYSWGGGHKQAAGPSTGTCSGYTGSIQPCPANRTVGLDCSGLVRWVYKQAFGTDVLGSGNTSNQVRRMQRVTDPQPGDLAFFGTATDKVIDLHHVGIYIGNGKMINALKTGTVVRVDNISALSDLAGYYRMR